MLKVVCCGIGLLNSVVCAVLLLYLWLLYSCFVFSLLLIVCLFRLLCLLIVLCSLDIIRLRCTLRCLFISLLLLGGWCFLVLIFTLRL